MILRINSIQQSRMWSISSWCSWHGTTRRGCSCFWSRSPHLGRSKSIFWSADHIWFESKMKRIFRTNYYLESRMFNGLWYRSRFSLVTIVRSSPVFRDGSFSSFWSSNYLSSNYWFGRKFFDWNYENNT